MHEGERDDGSGKYRGSRVLHGPANAIKILSYKCGNEN
jgi:hypothetical protein